MCDEVNKICVKSDMYIEIMQNSGVAVKCEVMIMKSDVRQ